MSSLEKDSQLKTVKPMLIVGIVLLPGIFVWALLEEGYSVSSRVFGFSYLIARIVVLILHNVLGVGIVSALIYGFGFVSVLANSIFKDQIEDDERARKSLNIANENDPDKTWQRFITEEDDADEDSDDYFDYDPDDDVLDDGDEDDDEHLYLDEYGERELVKIGLSNYELRKLHEKAKEGGALAQVLIGWKYHCGSDGLEKNYKNAAYWYHKSAMQGNADAQYNLGCLYQNGQGVDIELSRACYWYTIAAENGNAKAMRNLSVLYETGSYVEQDDEQAFFWIFLACLKCGSSDKGNFSESRDDLCNILSSSVSSRVEIAAKRWLASQSDKGDRKTPFRPFFKPPNYLK